MGWSRLRRRFLADLVITGRVIIDAVSADTVISDAGIAGVVIAGVVITAVVIYDAAITDPLAQRSPAALVGQLFTPDLHLICT